MKTFTAPLRFIFICIFPSVSASASASLSLHLHWHLHWHLPTHFPTYLHHHLNYHHQHSITQSGLSCILTGSFVNCLTLESSLPPALFSCPLLPYPFPMKTHASHDYYYYSCCALVPGKAQQQQKLHGKPLAIHLRDSSRCRLPAIRLCLSFAHTLCPSLSLSVCPFSS